MRIWRDKNGGDPSLFGSVGWLFADLMLALVVTAFLVTVLEPGSPKAASPVPPTTSISVTPPPTTTTTTPPRERLSPEPIKIDVQVDERSLIGRDPAAVNGLLSGVRGQLTGPMAGRRAGLVLTFGTATTGDIQRGIRVATQFNDQVLRGVSEQFRDTAFRAYFQGGADLRKVSVEVFVFET